MRKCPKCESSDIEETTKGIISGPDTNRSKCLNCGWRGIAEETKCDDLVKK